MAVLFLIFWIRSVQNGLNLIKLDQIGFLIDITLVPSRLLRITLNTHGTRLMCRQLYSESSDL